jgi:DNA-binding transcriptional MerR regulator
MGGAEASNVIQAFSADQAVRLTSLSKGQLRYWDQTGFFRPRHASENRRVPFSRIYSFRDVVGLKTLAMLRKEHGVSLQHLRRVAEKLSHLSDSIWTETTLYVLNGEVHFREPDTGRVVGAVSGQYVASIPLARVATDVSAEAAGLKKRTDQQRGKIERHRYVAHNAWVVSGTRIPISSIQRFKEAGYTNEQIIQEYPSLTLQDIEAALSHEGKIRKRA